MRVRSFREQIESVLKERGMSKAALAALLGVSGTYVSQIVRSGGTPEQIERIAAALKLNPKTFDAYCVLTFYDRVYGGNKWARVIAALLIAGDQGTSTVRNRICDLVKGELE